jgi:transcriptional regulator with XRE-family HTH domain
MASFGETLRRERELRGVSLREIADATKISVRFLQALEQDRLDVLPGGVFRRSFVKQYAKHLGLDADRLAAEFVYAHGEQVQEPAPSSNRREKAHPGTLFLIAAVGSAAVLSLWKAAPERAQGIASAPLPPRVVAPAAPAPAAAATVAEEGLVITLQAQATCWIEARVDGQPAVNRVLEQGQSERLLAKTEIVLSVGNAGGLSFTVNDRQGLPLGKSGEVRRNIVITKQSLPSLVEEPSQLRASQSS